MTDTLPISRELVERAPTLYSITGDIKDINTLLIPRSALTQQAEGVVLVAEAMGALIAAWNRLTKLHGWTRAWEPEPGDAGWIPAHEQMQRAINALISAQPSGEVLTAEERQAAIQAWGGGHMYREYDADDVLAIACVIESVTIAKIGGSRG